MKKNKLALFSVPYVLWMAVFVVIPILMIVVTAFSSAGAALLGEFCRIGDYMVVFTRSFRLAFIATAICLLLGYPRLLLSGPGGAHGSSARGHDAHHAAHVDELPAADLMPGFPFWRIQVC